MGRSLLQPFYQVWRHYAHGGISVSLVPCAAAGQQPCPVAAQLGFYLGVPHRPEHSARRADEQQVPQARRDKGVGVQNGDRPDRHASQLSGNRQKSSRL